MRRGEVVAWRLRGGGFTSHMPCGALPVGHDRVVLLHDIRRERGPGVGAKGGCILCFYCFM